MTYLTVEEVARRAGLSIEEVRALVEEYGPGLDAMQGDGGCYVNPVALYRVQRGLPPERRSRHEMSELLNRRKLAMTDQPNVEPTPAKRAYSIPEVCEQSSITTKDVKKLEELSDKLVQVMRWIEKGDLRQAGITTVHAQRDLAHVLRDTTGKRYQYPEEAHVIMKHWFGSPPPKDEIQRLYEGRASA